MDPLKIINALRATDPYIATIFTQGGCYKLHEFLLAIYPNATALINEQQDHIATQIFGRLFDISGEVAGEGFRDIAPEELDTVKQWSFHGNKLLSLGECPHCEEPLLIEPTQPGDL